MVIFHSYVSQYQGVIMTLWEWESTLDGQIFSQVSNYLEEHNWLRFRAFENNGPWAPESSKKWRGRRNEIQWNQLLAVSWKAEAAEADVFQLLEKNRRWLNMC